MRASSGRRWCRDHGVVRHSSPRLLALAAALGTAALPTGAQATRFDTSLVHTLTLGALVRAAQAGDSMAGFKTTSPDVHALFTRSIARLDRPEIERIGLELLASRQAGLGVVSRRQRPTSLSAQEAAALDTLARVMGEELPDALAPVISHDSANRLLDPLEALTFARRGVSIAQSLEKLRRFERKYGPGSPRLNVVEVGLNFVAQWIPAFRPSPEGWPSRLEVVASYVPTYLTVANGKARAVTVAEFGPRVYVWREGWGGRRGGKLRPGYISFGAALAGERDGALSSPFRGASRFGAFVGWGDAKIALIGGRAARLLVTRQVQLVPWVF